MEAQACGSYPVATDLSNSAMEVQASDSLSSCRQQIIATVLSKCRLASGSYPAAAPDHSNSTIGKHRLEAAIQQQIIATVLWKHRLVAAIQQQQQQASSRS